MEKNDYNLTEYWFVPVTAQFPPYIELKRASTVFGNKVLEADELIKNERSVKEINSASYSDLLHKIADQMKMDKSARVVLQMPFLPNSGKNAEIRKRTNQALQYFTKEGIARYRVKTKMLYSMPPFTALNKVMKFPDIWIVRER